MTQRRYELDKYADGLLLALYDTIVLGGGGKATFSFMKEHLPVKTDNLAKLCIGRLVERRDIETETVIDRQTRGEITYFFVSKDGFARVTAWSDDEHGKISSLLSGQNPPEYVPASDRIVTLDHNQPDYRDAVDALDKVLAEFQSDHRLDNELGPQKEARLKVLEGGRKALDDKEISVEDVQNWIVKPLKWIAEKFADGTLKALAMKALEEMAKLCGLVS